MFKPQVSINPDQQLEITDAPVITCKATMLLLSAKYLFEKKKQKKTLDKTFAEVFSNNK